MERESKGNYREIYNPSASTGLYGPFYFKKVNYGLSGIEVSTPITIPTLTGLNGP
jgi:hypothetical protein